MVRRLIRLQRVDAMELAALSRCVGRPLPATEEGDYSGLVSELPEKAATMAGEMTIATKVRPIRRSCIEVAPWRGSSELFHSLMMPEVTRLLNSTITLI